MGGKGSTLRRRSPDSAIAQEEPEKPTEPDPREGWKTTHGGTAETAGTAQPPRATGQALELRWNLANCCSPG